MCVCVTTSHCNTHCNTLQHTTIHCSTLLLTSSGTTSWKWDVRQFTRDVPHSHVWHDAMKCVPFYTKNEVCAILQMKCVPFYTQCALLTSVTRCIHSNMHAMILASVREEELCVRARARACACAWLYVCLRQWLWMWTTESARTHTHTHKINVPGACACVDVISGTTPPAPPHPPPPLPPSHPPHSFFLFPSSSSDFGAHFDGCEIHISITKGSFTHK